MTTLTYAGIFDDRVDAYPWNNVSVSEGYINRQLLHFFVYGKTVLLNDGYLVAHPVLVEQLISSDNSLVGALIHAETVRLYMRGTEPANIADAIKETAEKSRIKTHLDIIGSEKWKREIRPALEHLGKSTSSKCIGWPQNKNTGEIFVKLLESVLDARDEDVGFPHASKSIFEDAFHAYLDRNANDRKYPSARGVWEEGCENLKSFRSVKALSSANEKKIKIELMQIANECYHMSHAIGSYASRNTGEFSDRSVLTGLSNLFHAFIRSDDFSDNDENILAARSILISLPDSFKMSDYSTLVGLSTKKEFIAKRQAYVTCLEDLIFGKQNGSLDKARKASEEYQGYLLGALGYQNFEPQGYNRFVGKTVKFFVGQEPLTKMLIYLLDLNGVRLQDWFFQKVYKNIMTHKARSLQGVDATVNFIRNIGLMQKTVDKDKATVFLKDVGSFD